jgi:hypothetical protein
MLGEPAIQDLELFVRSNLAPRLVAPGHAPRVQRPAAASMIPGGCLEALTRSVGRCDLEDMLLVSASVRPAGPWWRHRCLYAPLCVLGIGELGLGLWVQALPSPDVRIVLVFDEIGVIEQSAYNPWRELTVTGQDGELSVRYDVGGELPRCSVTGATARSRSLLLHSSTVGARFQLPSRAEAAVACQWLNESQQEDANADDGIAGESDAR